MFTRILVPLDGSKLAERALPAAEELARLMRTPLHLVRVVDATPVDEVVLTAGMSSTFITEEGAAANAYLERMTAREVESGLSASSEVHYGMAAREIVTMAQPGDLIVMSTHGRGALGRWFLGSVAEDVIRRAPVPVLLIRTTPDHNGPVG